MSNKPENNTTAERILRYYAIQSNAFKLLIKSSDMPYSHYQVLSLLGERGQMRMGEISDIMGISRPNLTPLVDKLVAQHYVNRFAHVTDRRVTYLGLSDTGRLALENEHNSIIGGMSNFTSKLSEKESEKFVKALDVITEIFPK